MEYMVMVLCGGVCLVLIWLGMQFNRYRSEEQKETSRLLEAMRQVESSLAHTKVELRNELLGAQTSSLKEQGEHVSTLQTHLNETSVLMQTHLEALRGSVGQRLTQLSTTVNEQLQGQVKEMGEMKTQIGALHEAADGLKDLGREVSHLQDILRAPKPRGALGELMLEELLRQVLPSGAYEMQFGMAGLEAGSRVVVDAVIRMGRAWVAIDSKFPLESFERLLALEGEGVEVAKGRKEFLQVVKKHIDAVGSKYVRPDLGTYDFALMYLPSESLYYEAVIRDGVSLEGSTILAHANQAKVVLVSPHTFYAYLLSVAYGLKGLEIEGKAETIRADLMGVQKKFAAFYKVFEKTGRHIILSQRSYEDSLKRAGKLYDKVAALTGDASELDPAGEEAGGAEGDALPRQVA